MSKKSMRKPNKEKQFQILFQKQQKKLNILSVQIDKCTDTIKKELLEKKWEEQNEMMLDIFEEYGKMGELYNTIKEMYPIKNV